MLKRLPLAFGSRVSADFRERIWSICDGFGWAPAQPSDLMACIAWETGGTFSPSIVNRAGSGATGLIQFMPDTAIELGTTTKRLAAMTAGEQLYYVEKYFKPYARRIFSLSDMYMAILLPKFVGQADASVLFSGETKAYRQNSGLDIDTDGKITKAEATQKVREMQARGMLVGNVYFSPEDFSNVQSGVETTAPKA